MDPAENFLKDTELLSGSPIYGELVEPKGEYSKFFSPNSFSETLLNRIRVSQIEGDIFKSQAQFIELTQSPINWATTIGKHFVSSPGAHFFRDLTQKDESSKEN
ncbi:MAG: hypothetical protein ACE5KJ_04460 [Candidatus Zixiibacteriota bacterium]